MVGLYRKIRKKWRKLFRMFWKIVLGRFPSLTFVLHKLFCIFVPIDERVILLSCKEGAENEVAKSFFEAVRNDEKYYRFRVIWAVEDLDESVELKKTRNTHLVSPWSYKWAKACARARYLVCVPGSELPFTKRKAQVSACWSQDQKEVKGNYDYVWDMSKKPEDALFEIIDFEVGVADGWLKKRIRKYEAVFMILKNLKNGFKRVKKAVRNFIKDKMKIVAVTMDAAFYTVLGALRKKGLFQNENYKKLLSYKDKHKGERCFLIGNGPSLTTSDLELLKDETTFACNMICKIYDQTTWRPDYHCMIDGIIAKYQCEEFMEKLSGVLFTNKSTYRILAQKPDDDDQCVQVTNVGKSPYYVKGDMLTYYVPSGATVMGFMLELAMFMGFKEIYLIGVDCTASNAPQGHFVKGYVSEELKEKDRERVRKRMKNPDMTNEEIDEYYFNMSTYTYRVVKKYADEHDVKIYNATRGGALEVYDRVVLEDVLKGGLA